MSQSEISKATAADARSESARSFVRTVKAATRRKYPPEERIRIVLEGFRRGVTVNDLCRREGIKPHSYYAWTKEFMEAGKERLTRDTVRNATQQEIEQFKRENGELKQVICRSLAAGTPSQKNGYPDAGRLHRYQRMSGGEKAAVLARVGLSSDPIRQVLRDLGVPKSTYYRWLRRQRCQGLEDRPGGSTPAWNRLRPQEEQVVLTAARQMPELSSRQLAVLVTDNHGFFVSESTLCIASCAGKVW